MSRPKDSPLSFDSQEENSPSIKKRYEAIKSIAERFPNNNFVKKNWNEETIRIKAIKSQCIYEIGAENVIVLDKNKAVVNDENVLKNAERGLLQLQQVIFASIVEDDIQDQTFQNSQNFLNLIKDEDDKKAIVNYEKKITDDLKEPLFFLICDALNIDLMNVFLQNGVDVNLRNKRQESALHKVVCSDENPENKLEAARFLTEQGANPYLMDDEGWCAYEYANLETEGELYELLGGKESAEEVELSVQTRKNKRVEQVKRFGKSELKLNFDLPKAPKNYDTKPKNPSNLRKSFSASSLSQASPDQERSQ